MQNKILKSGIKFISHFNTMILVILLITFAFSAAHADTPALIKVKSTISQDGSMYREVITPSNPEINNFAKIEFLGDATSEIKTETLADGTIKLSRTFQDLEDCVGVLMVQKDLYFSERFQVRQSIPQYFDEKIMKNIKAQFEFNMPENIIKVQKDRKQMRGQIIGPMTIKEFALDRAGNMDIFYQYPNYKPILAVLAIVLILFITAKFVKSFNFILVPVLAVIIAFIFAALVVYFIGESPISAMGAMYSGVFSSKTNFFNMLLAATPLIFTGLAVAVSFNCNLFNIGGESQLMVGAFVAAWIGYNFQLPAFIHIPFAFIGAGLAAGLYAMIAGWLRARFQVHEVISTIMLNYIAYTGLGYLVLLPYFKEEGPNPQTHEILNSAMLPVFSHGHDLNYGFIFAILTALVVWFILYKTVIGFNIRSVGFNEKAAEYGGINISRCIISTMFISGLLAGFGGTERVLGLFDKYNSTAFIGYGFDGIAVSLLVNNNPLGIIISSLLFGFLKCGGSYMNREIGVPVELVVIVQAVIIFFIAADKIVKNMLKLKDA
ncbi:MAG: ABC transporter permease [Candidatus Wallbacteria bacterium]